MVREVEHYADGLTGLRGFVNGMSDLFHARVPTRSIEQVFAMIGETPQQT